MLHNLIEDLPRDLIGYVVRVLETTNVSNRPGYDLRLLLLLVVLFKHLVSALHDRHYCSRLHLRRLVISREAALLFWHLKPQAV